MELRVEPGSDEEFSFWRFSRKRRNPEPTGGIRPHILLALQHIEPPPPPGRTWEVWSGGGGSGVLDEEKCSRGFGNLHQTQFDSHR